METLDWDPNVFRRSCLLHYLLCCASAVQFTDQRCEWQGNLAQGGFDFDNGSGDAYRVRWDGPKLVALCIDHESERSPYNEEDIDWEDNERLYHRYMPGLPNELADFYQAACDEFHCVTAGLWQTGNKLVSPEPFKTGDDNGLWMFNHHWRSPEEATFGTMQSWQELLSISEAQARLMITLLADANKLPRELSAEEGEIMMQVGEPPETFPICGVDLAKQMLAKAQYIWT